MVLRDASLLSMTVDEWSAATAPKVQGTWNLHRESLNQDLDFFLLFCSMYGIFGMPGQANYAAANTFMDAFVQYRHQCRLPASVLDLGAIDSIGHVAENPHILERSKWLSHVQMSQKELFDAVTLVIYDGDVSGQSEDRLKTNRGQIISGFKDIDIDSEKLNSRAFLCDNRMAVYSRSVDQRITPGESGPVNELANFVTLASSNKEVLIKPAASGYVATQIAKWVFDLLMKPVEDESEIDIARSWPMWASIVLLLLKCGLGGEKRLA